MGICATPDSPVYSTPSPDRVQDHSCTLWRFEIPGKGLDPASPREILGETGQSGFRTLRFTQALWNPGWRTHRHPNHHWSSLVIRQTSNAIQHPREWLSRTVQREQEGGKWSASHGLWRWSNTTVAGKVARSGWRTPSEQWQQDWKKRGF